MNIIEKIRAEVERLKKDVDNTPLATEQIAGYLFALVDVQKRLSDLEKSEKPSEGLEEEIERYLSTEWELDEDLNKNEPIYIYDCTWEDLKVLARHFAQWQRKQDRAEIAKQLSKKWTEGYDEGMKTQKEAMLRIANEHLETCDKNIASYQDAFFAGVDWERSHYLCVGKHAVDELTDPVEIYIRIVKED